MKTDFISCGSLAKSANMNLTLSNKRTLIFFFFKAGKDKAPFVLVKFNAFYFDAVSLFKGFSLV